MIETARLADVVFMERPVFGQPNSPASIFRLEADGKYASRVAIKLGHASVNNIEILDGLKPGDQVIVSDTPNQEQNSRIRLN